MVRTDATLGRILVDGAGKTLYLYSRDEKKVSNCYDNCERAWPILRPPASGAPTGSSDINGTLAVIDRRDGTKQVTYNDIPLYYYAQDAAPNDTKGQAVGNVWWILAPGLNTITQGPAAAPAAAQPSPAAKPAAPAAAQPSPAAKPAAQVPAALPRTGGTPIELLAMIFGSGAAGLASVGIGARLLRRGKRRSE